MKSRLFRFVLALVILSALGIGTLVVRNSQLDAGVVALKEGDGVAALEKFTPLARLGDAQAQFLIGSMYAYGWGVAKSDSNALYWFRRAGRYASGESDPAAPAALGVAKSYAEGTDGVQIDRDESAKWLRIAAAGGSKEAAALLAKSR